MVQAAALPSLCLDLPCSRLLGGLTYEGQVAWCSVVQEDPYSPEAVATFFKTPHTSCAGPCYYHHQLPQKCKPCPAASTPEPLTLIVFKLSHLLKFNSTPNTIMWGLHLLPDSADFLPSFSPSLWRLGRISQCRVLVWASGWLLYDFEESALLEMMATCLDGVLAI
jgi:hypothetical protein